MAVPSTIVGEDNEEDDDGAVKGDKDSDDDNDEFFKVRGATSQTSVEEGTVSNIGRTTWESTATHRLAEDNSSRIVDGDIADIHTSVWLNEEEGCLLESLREKFVTCNSKGRDGARSNVDKDGEGYGAVEDLKTGEKYGPNGDVYYYDEEETERKIHILEKIKFLN